jgi:hypothetical protein
VAPAVEPREFECDVPSALPFLALGPLARIDYLRGLAATLHVAKAHHLAPALAVAIARKALAPPGRGWYRTREQQAVAWCFAGRAGSIEDAEIMSAATALRSQLPMLDQIVTANLVAGHRAEAHWLLCSVASAELALFDSDGLFPVATGSAKTLGVLMAPSGSPVYVAQDSATPGLFDGLEALRIPYATTTRGGPGAPRISAHGAHQGRMRAFAERGEELCERARLSWHAIRKDRPIFRDDPAAPLETSLTLAMSLALGTLAWTLWHEREPPDPSASRGNPCTCACLSASATGTCATTDCLRTCVTFRGLALAS